MHLDASRLGILVYIVALLTHIFVFEFFSFYIFVTTTNPVKIKVQMPFCGSGTGLEVWTVLSIENYLLPV